MQLTHHIHPNTSVVVEGATQSDVFKELSSAVEVFGAFGECGACKSPAVPRVRVVDSNSFHEAVCTNPKCRSVLAFGAHKKNGSLFPKRKDADGKFLDHGGWVRWTPDSKKS